METVRTLNLFGDEFEIKIAEPKVKDIIKKAQTKKEQKEIDPEKLLKSKKISLQERLDVIRENVYKILGKRRENILLIKDKETFVDYVQRAINSGRIDIDTETNNSTDPSTAKLMGLCLYYPEGKQVYVPINHRDPETKERLDWQLTEEDCREELQKINDSGIMQIYHNAKFDYEVLKCTCNIEMKPSWDTFIAAWLIDENKYSYKHASLKYLYTTLIDPNQEKYSLDSLFEHIPYADLPPELFAYYASQDAFMTDKIYLWELPFYEDPANIKIRELFLNIELPITTVTANMELTGVKIDEELGERLKEKYNRQLVDLDSQVIHLIDTLKPIIAEWRLTKDANEQTIAYAPKKSKMADEKIEQQYPLIEAKTGLRYKKGKSKNEQLSDDINLNSPTQLAILFYDVLEVPAGKSRKTGKEDLKGITEVLARYLADFDDTFSDLLDDEEEDVEDVKEAIDIPKDKVQDFKFGCAAKIASLLLTRRGISKLITTYIDVIPKLAQHWPDGRIRYNLNSAGTNTGRYSSGGKWKWLVDDKETEISGINVQNIPSRGDGKIIRLLFKADTKYHKVEYTDFYTIPETDEVETINGWKKVQDLVVGDTVVGDEGNDIIVDIKQNNKNFYLFV